jgi:hypothetical protein
VEIDIRTIPEEIKSEFSQILGGPIQTAVKKAAKQTKGTKALLKNKLDPGILIAVNNGYGSFDSGVAPNQTIETKGKMVKKCL